MFNININVLDELFKKLTRVMLWFILANIKITHYVLSIGKFVISWKNGGAFSQKIRMYTQ